MQCHAINHSFTMKLGLIYRLLRRSSNPQLYIILLPLDPGDSQESQPTSLLLRVVQNNLSNKGQLLQSS